MCECACVSVRVCVVCVIVCLLMCVCGVCFVCVVCVSVCVFECVCGVCECVYVCVCVCVWVWVCVCELPASDQSMSCFIYEGKTVTQLVQCLRKNELLDAVSFLSPVDRNTPIFPILVSFGERWILDKALKRRDIKERNNLYSSLNIVMPKESVHVARKLEATNCVKF